MIKFSLLLLSPTILNYLKLNICEKQFKNANKSNPQKVLYLELSQNILDIYTEIPSVK